jgi:hypothetical protein
VVRRPQPHETLRVKRESDAREKHEARHWPTCVAIAGAVTSGEPIVFRVTDGADVP